MKTLHSKNLLPIFLFVYFLLNIGLYAQPDACTSILVTKGASKNGECIITYSCDGEFLARLGMSPAMDYQPGDSLEINRYGGRMNIKSLSVKQHSTEGLNSGIRTVYGIIMHL